MIELPESITIAKQIQETLVGKEIASVMMNQSPHKFAFFSKPASEYEDILPGKVVTGGESHGGQLQMNLSEGYQLVFTDGAFPRYHEADTKVPAKHQMMITFQDKSFLTVSIQMYGAATLTGPTEDPGGYYTTAISKPSPLSDEFTFEYFHQIYDNCSKNLSVKAFLATEQRIPGLGNGVLQDILFYAKIHPKKKLSDISEKELQQIYQAICSVLSEMVEQGGRDTEKDLFSNHGKYMMYLSKTTYLTPCPICGNEIRKAAYMGGTVYFCEKCQPL